MQTTEGKPSADLPKIQGYFRAFHEANQEAMQEQAERWVMQSRQFREFWQTRIMNEQVATLPEDDLIPAAQILETSVKRRSEEEKMVISVARTGLAGNILPRILQTIHSEKGLRTLIDKLLRSTGDGEQAQLIDEIYRLNKGKGNSITGKHVVVLNDLLYAYAPEGNFAVLSMEERQWLMEYLGIRGSLSGPEYTGSQVVESRAKLLQYKDRIGPGISTWEFKKFVYSDIMAAEWRKRDEGESDSEEQGDATTATVGDINQLTLERVLRERKAVLGATWAPIWAEASGKIGEIKEKLLAAGTSLVEIDALQQKLPGEVSNLTDFMTPAGMTASRATFLQNQAFRDLLGRLPNLTEPDEIRSDLLSLHVPYLGVSSFSTLASFVRPDLFMSYHGGITRGAPELHLPRIQGSDTDFGAYLDIMRLFKTVSKSLGIGNMYEVGYYLAKGGAKPKWWVEKTTLTGHPLSGLAQFDTGFGKSLWSPQTDERGAKRYEAMKHVEPGDVILHINQDSHANSILGVSRATGKSDQFTIPQGTQWTRDGPKPGFFVPLSGYKNLTQPVKWDDLRKAKATDLKDINERGANLFFDKNLDFNQGAYLTGASQDLVKTINDFYKSATKQDLPFYEGAAAVTVSTPTDPLSGEVSSALSTSNQVILFGPPGTGKTYAALRYVEKVDDDRKMFITFHPSYSYEEFIEGIRPRPGTTGLVFEVIDGKFKAFCIDAFNALLTSAGIAKQWTGSVPDLTPEEKSRVVVEAHKEGNRFFLIIDEINRGDISKIFGELITLIESDKRLTRENEIVVSLTYSPKGSKFGVPPNLYVIGTMNTADRSIALIDVALRRRFRFIELLPDYALLTRELLVLPSDIADLVVSSLRQLNEKLRVHYDRNHQIGHAYFIKLKNSPTRPEAIKALKQAWFYEIIPLLQEYFYNNSRLFYEVLNKDQRLFSDPPSEANRFSFVLKTPDTISDSDFVDFLTGLSKPT